MNPALFRLLMFRLRGGLRQRVIQLTSLRGFLFFLAFGGIIWLLIETNSSTSDLGVFNTTPLDRQAFSDEIRTFMPLGMLAMSLLTVALSTGPTFHFSQSEINFLFTGPFKRRDLIIYKFGAYVAGVFLSCALITPFAMNQTGSAITAFLAALLTLVFVQLNSAAIVMAVQATEGSWFDRIRRPLVALLILVAITSAAYTWLVPDRSLFDLLSQIRHSWIGTIILLPYIVFAELFVVGPHVAKLAIWATIAVLINAVLLYFVILLDARTTDRALAENARMSAAWERMRQGGSFWATDRTEVRSLRRAPIFGGLGPIAWRQALHAARNSAKSIALFIGIAACVGPLTLALGTPITDPQTPVFLYIFFGFILPRTLVCDFRGDLSRMELYKTLPIAPWRICAGQLVVQSSIAYLIAVTIIFSISLFDARVTLQIALIFAVFALPFTVLIYATENTIQLLFPAKLLPMGQADFEFLGRSLVEFIGKTTFIIFALTASAAVGIILFNVFDVPLVLSGVISWLALCAIVLFMLFIMQSAFRQFAVSETVD